MTNRQLVAACRAAFHCMLLAALPCAAQPGALAQPGPPAMVICMEEQPHPPHLLADGGGTVPLLVQMAAQRAGVAIRLYRAPSRRCLAEMRSGLVHAYAAAAPGTTVTSEFALPMAGDAPDPARAVTTLRQVVYRRTGSAANWDGTRFSGLLKPVLCGASFLATADRLRQLGATYDNNAGGEQQNLEKLLVGRGDAMIGIDTDVAPLLRLPRYAGAIEALPVPFSESQHYLIVAPAYYQANRAAVEALWHAIGVVRVSAPYVSAAAKLGQPAAPPVGKE